MSILSTANFVEIEAHERNMDNLLKSFLDTKDDHKHEYFVERDLEYPPILHKNQTLSILSRENNIRINQKIKNQNIRLFRLCDETKSIKNKHSEKLIMDRANNQKYLIHYRGLKFFFKHGMKVTKLRFLYQYKQSPWLTKFVKNNADQRAKAKTKCENFL